MVAGLGLAAVGLTRGAEAATREDVRLTLLDRCVYAESQKRQVKDRIVDDCSCASEKVSKALSDADIAAFSGRLNAAASTAWDAAVAACFK